MKRTVIHLLRWFFRRPGFFLRFKDTVMVNAAEHLFRTKKYIDVHNPGVDRGLIVDVGAASGDTVCWFASEFPANRIIAFEPLKSAWQIASRKTRHLEQVTLFNCALSDTARETDLYVTRDRLACSLKMPDESDGPARELRGKLDVVNREKVATRRLDDLIDGNENVLLLKIDTQGTELEVLKGGASTLRRTCLVLVEMNNNFYYQKGATYWEVDAYLRENGFGLVDIYVTYRPGGIMREYDALYRNQSL